MTAPRRAQRPDAPLSAEPPSNGPVELVAGERHIVARGRAGDEAAFVALLRLHYAALCKFATALTHASDQAEEIVQDLFAGIWERRAT